MECTETKKRGPLWELQLRKGRPLSQLLEMYLHGQLGGKLWFPQQTLIIPKQKQELLKEFQEVQ